jgi:RNA polymerase sigma-70 factor (ECF subfamily)
MRLLMRRYCGAVYHYLLAAVRDPAAAEDLSQEFALRFCRGDFRRADPDKGRFRDFVKTALYHLVVDHHRRLRSAPDTLPPDVEGPPAPELPGEKDFEAHWRQELLDRAWEALAGAAPLLHAALRARADDPGQTAAQLAQMLAAREGRPFNEVAVRQLLHRAREKFAGFLLEEVARSLGSDEPGRIEEELSELGLLAYCRPALDRR